MPSHHLSPGKGKRERDYYTKNSLKKETRKTRPQRRTKLLTINELHEDLTLHKEEKTIHSFIQSVSQSVSQSPSKRLVNNKAAKYQNNNHTTHS
jgi:hypothetical protein